MRTAILFAALLTAGCGTTPLQQLCPLCAIGHAPDCAGSWINRPIGDCAGVITELPKEPQP